MRKHFPFGKSSLSFFSGCEIFLYVLFLGRKFSSADGGYVDGARVRDPQPQQCAAARRHLSDRLSATRRQRAVSFPTVCLRVRAQTHQTAARRMRSCPSHLHSLYQHHRLLVVAPIISGLISRHFPPPSLYCCCYTCVHTQCQKFISFNN